MWGTDLSSGAEGGDRLDGGGLPGRVGAGDQTDDGAEQGGAAGQAQVGKRPAHPALGISAADLGIAAEHLPHILDRFYRADASRSRETGGSGLGLAITRHLVEAHGGTIEAQSTEGAGSTFTIRLPLADPNT